MGWTPEVVLTVFTTCLNLVASFFPELPSLAVSLLVCFLCVPIGATDSFGGGAGLRETLTSQSRLELIFQLGPEQYLTFVLFSGET